MRNLKRALSLLLSSTMVLGMLVMGSSAAGYQDVDASNVNQEAIEVLQTVGIMTGDQNGNFNPDGSITRNEMAVVMAHLLNLDYDYYRGTNPFTDVPEWAAPYVAACAAEGVVAGIGNGQYGGNQKVTAAQASLMVMKALGYFQNAEDFGTDWQVATIRQASYINLFDNINANAESALTRAQVAQLVLNGLKAQMVDFTGDKGIQIGDVTVGYNAEYTARTNANKKYNSIDTGKTDIAGNNQYYVQLGEELYNGDLKLADDEADVFGRPAHTWSFDGEKIGTYVNYDLMVEEYTTSVSGKELYDVVGKTAFDKYDFSAYVDGKDDDFYKQISKNNKDDVDVTDNGALTQVFVDSDAEEVVVTVINTYLAQATADYSESKDKATFEIYGISGTETVSGEDFNVADIAKDDFVLVTYADNEIQTISDVEIMSNVEISKFSANGSNVTAVTVDGTKYDSSATLTYDTGVLSNYTDNNLKDATYNVYLDQYGYVIGVDVVDKVNNYVFITGVDDASSNLSTKTWDANAIFMDGTSAVIEVKNDGTLTKDGPIINQWFTYTKSSSDVYTLDAIESTSEIIFDDNGDVAQKHSTEQQVPKIDDKHISVPGISRNTRVYGNDESVYLLAELDKVTVSPDSYAVIKGVDEVVTGVDNASFEVWGWDKAASEVGGVSAEDNDHLSYGVYALYDDDGYVIAAVVVGESGTTTSKVAYVSSSGLEDESYDKTTEKWTWTREVIINGEKVLLTETNDEDESVLEEDLTQGNWYTIKYDANGNVRSVSRFNDASEYATTISNAVTLIKNDNKDLIVVDIASSTNVYTLKGKTLYNVTTGEEGFRIADDANIVLKQETDNKTTTTYEQGVAALESILKDLNENPDHNYSFDAVIEDGRATSVIIVDKVGDNDFTGPEGPVKADYKFDALTATVDSNGAVKFDAADREDIVGWAMGNAKVEYTVSVNGGTQRVITQNIGDTSAAALAGQMTIPGLTVKNGSDIVINVLVTFNGTGTDSASVYTVGGTCYIF